MRKFTPEILMAAIVAMTAGLLCTAVPAVPPEKVRAAEPEKVTQELLRDEARTICVLEDGACREYSLHDYLIGVLLSEMPASFEPEALKAQAVASRTYALHCSKHDGADVCTDSGCCQGWTDTAAEAARDAAEAAVEATDGLVMTYDGALIDATFFSCSGGATEDAVAVWGCEVPYLRSVPSPGEEDAACFHSRVCLSAGEFSALLPQAELRGDPASWLGAVCRTAGGGMAEADIGGTVYTGTELRRIFGLRSTKFDLFYADGNFVFEVYGYGHRVGLSQYGAQAMAQAGADYIRILQTYYTGVTIAQA